MKKNIITHTYNEEYLMNWWLKHHREYFDHGVIIDFGSTDGTLDLVRDLCPTWDIVKMDIDYFDIVFTDYEVMKAESKLEGWKICLTNAEFLVGDFSSLDSVSEDNVYEIRIPSTIMVDVEPEIKPDPNLPLIQQKRYGIPYNEKFKRGCRLMHNKFYNQYTTGRHYLNPNCEEFKILWYGWSPFNETFIKRKLAIQEMIPDFMIKMGYGYHHQVTREELQLKYQELLNLNPSYINIL